MITIIAALAHDGVIGRGNDLPWNLPDDLKHFKEVTLGHPIIMGRRTYESLPRRPLPKRTNIVVSSNYESEGSIICASVKEALDKAREIDDEVFVIGGRGIFEDALSFADRLLLTHVHGDYEGDVFFPQYDESLWAAQETILATSEFTIVDYRRTVG